MSVQIAVRLADTELELLDAAIARGVFPNRTAAVRAGLSRVLLDDREAQIAEAYRRGYGDDPQEPSLGEAGLQLGASLIAHDERSTTSHE